MLTKKKSETSRLLQLEKRVDVAMKGLNILLFEDPEEIPPREKKLLQQRLRDYSKRKKSNFVELNKVPSKSFFTRKPLGNWKGFLKLIEIIELCLR
jgi:hypothetical protein